MNALPQLLADLHRLGLPPGANPDALKAAWRRAVSQWHPDRRGHGTDHTLSEINTAFQRLREFHRQNGRLPDHADLQTTPATASSTCVRRPRWMLIISALIVGLIVFWPHAEAPNAPAPPAAFAPVAKLDDVPIGRRPERLATGMTTDVVERLMGAPVLRSPDRWEYGPSIIHFSGGRVSGWYSSPLRPLPLATIDAASNTIN